MISAWWLMLLFPAFAAGFALGWFMRYFALAMLASACLAKAVRSAFDEMAKDGRAFREYSNEMEEVAK